MAPEATVTAVTAVLRAPSPRWAPVRTVPALTIKPPVNALAPDSSKVPAPSLVTDLDPLPAPVFWVMAALITRSLAAAPSATSSRRPLKVRSMAPATTADTGEALVAIRPAPADEPTRNSWMDAPLPRVTKPAVISSACRYS